MAANFTDKRGRKQEKWVMYWDGDGTDKPVKKEEGCYDDDHKTGKWTYWYLNGQKESEGCVMIHQPQPRVTDDEVFAADNMWTYWYKTGQMQEQGMRTAYDNHKTGTWMEWTEDGTQCRQTEHHYLYGYGFTCSQSQEDFEGYAGEWEPVPLVNRNCQ